MSRIIVGILIIAACLIAGCNSNSPAPNGNFRVQALGCLLPIPSRFVLNTNFDRGYWFYDSSDETYGEISITAFSSEQLSEFLGHAEIVAELE
jgi:hypothetical protein